MKNLKKALSLVLASAMLVGMMVVGTGAAHSDVKAEHNEEAIAVVSAAGIMGAGDTFNPDGEITRGEMAVIMTNMLGLDTKDFKGASNFTDAGWAADYIDACYANGIMAGVSATEFGTNVKVTTAQAALMMLKALGYYEKATLNDWMLDTIKMASKIELLDGIDAKASAVLTRNEVAQLALNALEATCVEETAAGSNTSIKGEGFEITVDSTVYTADLTTSKYDYDGSKDGKLQLIEKLFGGRFEKDAEGNTDLDLPAVEWYDNKEKETVIKAAKAADEIIIAVEETTAVEMYQNEVDEDFDEADMNRLTVNAGDVVYYYKNDDNSIKAYKVVYELAEITDIDTDVTLKDEKDGIKAYITIEIGKDAYIIDDVDFAGFNYEEDDYVLVAMKGNKVLDSELAETVEGKVTSINRKGQYKIDGEFYTADMTLRIGDEATWYLNKAGQIVHFDAFEEETSADYAVIYNIVDVTKTADLTEDGYAPSATQTVYDVYAILADGTKEKFTYVWDSEDEDTHELNVGDTFEVVAYSVEDDVISFETADGVIDNDTSVNFEDGAKKYETKAKKNAYADSKTVFIFAAKDEDDNKMVVTTATGIKKVDFASKDVSVVYKKTAVQYVFVNEAEAEPESEAQYAVLADSAYAQDKVDGKNVYTFETVDGELATKDSKVRDTLSSLYEGSIIAYVTEGDYVTEVKVVVKDILNAETAKVEYVGEDFYVIGGKDYIVADDAEISVISIVCDEDDDTVIDSMKVSEDELEKNDLVVIADSETDKDDNLVINVAYIVKIRK